MVKNVIILFCILMIPFAAFIIQHNKEDYVVDDEQNGLNQQIVIKFSHVVAEQTPKGLAAQRFAKVVEEKTNNQVKVEVYPNGILYSDEEEFEALKQGAIHMIAPATSKISSYFPELYLLELPFAFSSEAALNEALNGDIGKSLLKEVQSESVFGLSLWRNGFKQMTSNIGPLINPTHFYGQHFRIMPSRVIKDQFVSLNVNTNEIPFNLTYKSLEKDIVNGQENTFSNIYSKKFYEVQDYLTVSNHGFLGYIVLMNRPFWDKLDDEIQSIILEAMAEANAYNQLLGKEMNLAAYENIKANSTIRINKLSTVEKLEWMRRLAPVYGEYSPIIGKDLMDMLADLKNKYPITRY